MCVQVMSEVKKSGVNLTTVLTTHHHWYKSHTHNVCVCVTCVCVCVCVCACVRMPPVLTRDHASGNEKLASLQPGLKVCGNDNRIGALNHTVKHNQELKVYIIH